MKYPVIATRGILVFPKHEAAIDVGRKSSLNALDLSKNSFDSNLIIVSQKDVMQDKILNKNEIYNFGTLVSFKTNKIFENNSRTITVTGIKRVKIKNFNFNSGNMIEANYDVLNDESNNEKLEKELVSKISSKIDSIISHMATVPKNVLSNLTSGISSGELADIIGHYLPLTLSKKQLLLEENNVSKRLELVNKFIIHESQINEVDKSIDNTVKNTLDNQQREFLLREKKKVIEEELGEISSKDEDVEKWNEELENDKFPQEVKDILKKEIRKFRSIPPISAESHVIKNYIETIIKLPWKTYSKDSSDIEKAKNILDLHHYGLKKVKERIVEHLAVKINTKSNSSPILTLVGPPGVGKTTLGKSIAEAVGRKFVKVSLGGVRDESEIRGHRRTYVGAMPGKIINAFNKSQTSNPVILLDEIDKMSSDFKGDPTSAMLEVLDPEQNKNFQDHYLELEYDLSQVMFIATANFYSQIPPTLIDRVELIFLDQYTSEEKIQIAKNYIIPKVLKENGLKKSQFKLSTSLIEYIISKYTLEAGVRNLKKTLDKLARKIVLKIILKQLKDNFIFTKQKIVELLGKEKVYKEKLKGKKEIGLVNGMYYSEVGGGVIPIEVTKFPAKIGGVKLTGSIQKVMEESLEIAVAYVRKNNKKFKINFNFDKNIIQVHVPAGAVPKDGPSAGVAFTTALISALTNKPVDRNVSLTGEITLRGKILPIGGLKEKSIGSVELGVSKIFIPKDNERDIDELAKKVKENAEIIPVSDYMEIYKNLF